MGWNDGFDLLWTCFLLQRWVCVYWAAYLWYTQVGLVGIHTTVPCRNRVLV